MNGLPDNMPAEVDIVGARLDRSTDHYKAFGAAWAEHLSSEPHGIDTQVDSDGSGRIVFTRFREPPTSLSLYLGEYLYELRAALDNALYAAAIIDSGQNPPPNAGRLEWPICNDPDTWERHRKGRLSKLSPDLVDSLRRIQPFQAEYPGWNSLKILHDMARADRHRAVHFVTSFAAEGWLKFDQTLVSDVDVRIGPIADDGVIATFTWHGDFPITREHIDGETWFEVEVVGVEHAPGPNNPEPTRPWGSLDTRLRTLHKAVTEYVYGVIGQAADLRDERTQDA